MVQTGRTRISYELLDLTVSAIAGQGSEALHSQRGSRSKASISQPRQREPLDLLLLRTVNPSKQQELQQQQSWSGNRPACDARSKAVAKGSRSILERAAEAALDVGQLEHRGRKKTILRQVGLGQKQSGCIGSTRGEEEQEREEAQVEGSAAPLAGEFDTFPPFVPDAQ